MTETTDATAIFAPLWRRKWLILAVGVVVAVLSYVYYKHEKPTFSSSTQVYLGASTEEIAPGEKTVKGGGLNVTDQVTIINSIVVEEVRRRLRARHQASLVRGAKVKAKAPEKSQFITIAAEGHTAKGTELMANEVAQAYIRRHDRNRERTIDRVIATTRRQLRKIEAAGAPVLTKSSSSSSSSSKSGAGSRLSSSTILQQANLSTKIDQLESSLASTGAEQVKPASRAELLAPAPKKDAVFGFVIGIVLASIAAYMLARFDRRLRTIDGIESMFRLPILTALPKVPRPVVEREGQRRPARSLLEPLRRLHTSLQLGQLGTRGPGEGRRVILFLSPDAGDGKSTLIANLAMVQREAGERVAVVEANFRRPIQTRILGLNAAPGLHEVLAGTLSIEEAQQLPTMPALADVDGAHAGLATAVATRPTGSLFLLAGSNAVANPPALMASEGMAELLRSLGEDYDYVLIDAPSPLEVSDVMPLLRIVDGIVLVARAGHTRETSAHRLLQLLTQSSAAGVLGTVANCVSQADVSRQGLSTSVRRGWLSKLLGP